MISDKQGHSSRALTQAAEGLQIPEILYGCRKATHAIAPIPEKPCDGTAGATRITPIGAHRDTTGVRHAAGTPLLASVCRRHQLTSVALGGRTANYNAVVEPLYVGVVEYSVGDEL